MQYFHVHISVENIAESVRFYSQLFGQQPSVEKADYAKWQMEDPRVNFAISARGSQPGLDHLGFQTMDSEELAVLRDRAIAADSDAVIDDAGATCCYAQSDKHWIVDPSGLAWEQFHTTGEALIYGTNHSADNGGCCTPAMEKVSLQKTHENSNSPAQRTCCGPELQDSDAP